MIAARSANDPGRTPVRERRVAAASASWRTTGPVTALLRYAVFALALAACGASHAETRVYLLRGWFGVFSSGIDAMADELRAKGVKAEAIGHLQWKAAVARIVKEREAGARDRLVLVGHSQGGNNIVDMARELAAHEIGVDLLITLAPFLQDPVPPNVVRAVNYYQAGGWGSPLTAAPAFNGELRNIDIGGDTSTLHVTIDKNARVQQEVIAAILALGR